MNTREEIKENIARIKEALGGAKLLAATKTIDAETINFAIECGVDAVGENKVQEVLEKYDKLRLGDAEYHFIGRLQTNKVKYIVDKVDMIESVDREALALEIEKRCAAIGKIMPVLVEVNVGGEESKGGIKPEELSTFCEFLSTLPHIKLRGLMAIPPKAAEGAKNDEYFSKMSKIFIDIRAKNVDNSNINILSMGMSGDYADALKNGSTEIRIGSAIFGERVYKIR